VFSARRVGAATPPSGLLDDRGRDLSAELPADRSLRCPPRVE
jgi:hypothetical protein